MLQVEVLQLGEGMHGPHFGVRAQVRGLGVQGVKQASDGIHTALSSESVSPAELALSDMVGKWGGAVGEQGHGCVWGKGIVGGGG